MLFLRHLRLGLRLLRRHPSFAASAIAVMALGIGGTTAVFSVVKGVLLTPLPFREPDRVVLFRADAPGYVHQAALNREEFFAVRDRAPASLTAPDQMEAVTGVSASDEWLPTLGVVPVLGRLATRRDVGEKYVNAVTISHELWSRRFNRDPDIVGRAIEVNNLPMRVAGVLPADFHLYLGPDVINPRVDIWYPRPLSYDSEDFRGRIVIARLRRDVTIETARAASVPLGFEPERALTMNIALQGQRFNQGTLAEARATRLEFDNQLVAAVRQIRA